MKKTYAQIEKENQALVEAVVEFQWMARRYADGRMTYTAHVVNDHTYKLLKMGVCLSVMAEGTFFAHDGQENLEKNCFCIPKHYLDLEKEILSDEETQRMLSEMKCYETLGDK